MTDAEVQQLADAYRVWQRANEVIGAALSEWFGVGGQNATDFAVAIQARLAHAGLMVDTIEPARRLPPSTLEANPDV